LSGAARSCTVHNCEDLTPDPDRKDAPDLSRIVLRPWDVKDVPDLLRLDARCFPPLISYTRAELQYFVRHPRSTTTVAELDGQIAGFCVVDWKLEAGRKVGHFITIDVAPELRRNGLGRRLMQTGEANLMAMGCVAITLEVAANNTGAQAFYGRLGYRQTGWIPGYYADGTNALVMRKSLTAGK
jgi:ribosomal-protein-alanine N-acetyltransferase